MILPVLAALLMLGGQTVPADPAAAAEARAASRMRAADLAAATGVPRMIAEAPEKGEMPPRSLYMPILDELYPPSALGAEQQGVVRLRCTLTVTGMLEACAMEASSGVPALDVAAFEVAKFARYSPWIVDRVPQARQVTLPVRWMIAE